MPPHGLRLVLAGQDTGPAVPSLRQSGATGPTTGASVTLSTVAGKAMLAGLSGAEAALHALPAPWTLLADLGGAGSSTARSSIWIRTAPGGSTVTTVTGSTGLGSLVVTEWNNVTTTPLLVPAFAGPDGGTAGNGFTFGPTSSTASALTVAVVGLAGTVATPAVAGWTLVPSLTVRCFMAWTVEAGPHTAAASWSGSARRSTACIAALA